MISLAEKDRWKKNPTELTITLGMWNTVVDKLNEHTEKIKELERAVKKIQQEEA